MNAVMGKSNRLLAKLIIMLVTCLFSYTVLAAVETQPTTAELPSAPPDLSNQIQKPGASTPSGVTLVPQVITGTSDNKNPQPKPNALASPIPKPADNAKPMETPTPPQVQGKGYILLDANTGYIIAQQNPHERMAPASLTKLMTMYVISGMIKNGRIKLTDEVPISETAWRTGGSRMFIQVGTQVPVKDLIDGIVVASGNDACVAMSEYIAGSEQAFVGLMNQTAQYLGMKDTHYSDATGLPDPNNYTTPYDLSILTRAIIEHYPEDYKWYSQQWMSYNNIKQPNRNQLLFRDPSVDGLKTGFTDDAGYCLVASAKRDGMRLVAIVMGSTSPNQRAKDAQALLNYGYHFYKTGKLYQSGTAVTTLPVSFGENKEVGLSVLKDVYVTVPTNDYGQLKATVSVNQPLKAPIVKGQKYGQIQVTLGGKVMATQPLVALADNPKAGFFARVIDHIKLFFSSFLG